MAHRRGVAKSANAQVDAPVRYSFAPASTSAEDKTAAYPELVCLISAHLSYVYHYTLFLGDYASPYVLIAYRCRYITHTRLSLLEGNHAFSFGRLLRRDACSEASLPTGHRYRPSGNNGIPHPQRGSGSVVNKRGPGCDVHLCRDLHRW